MALETRKGRGTYYTRSRKVAGRVIREYVASGETALLMARCDAFDRMHRENEAAMWQLERDSVAATDKEVQSYYRMVEHALRAELASAGYHQHARGHWRRKRG